MRAPTRIDRDISLPGVGTPMVVGNKDFESEEVVAYELGYRMAASAAAVFEAVAFYNDYDSCARRSRPPAWARPCMLGNRGQAHIRGVGISGSWQALAAAAAGGLGDGCCARTSASSPAAAT